MNRVEPVQRPVSGRQPGVESLYLVGCRSFVSAYEIFMIIIVTRRCPQSDTRSVTK